jgi:ABC-2 type transport system ATP-binding protein
MPERHMPAPPGPDGPALEVRQLTKVYPNGVRAVEGISFTVRSGEVFGLLGPNGAGKSTTIGILTTAVLPTSGTARVAGHDVVAEPLAARAVSSVVFQDSVLDRAMTGRSNIRLHAQLWGVAPASAARRIAELADAFGLADLLDRPVATYSGGERRRLEIVRALVSEPRVLFLDEPTVGLDTRIRYELLDLIGRLRARSAMTTVLTTHYLDEAERLCDRIAIVHAGRIVALDSPAALLARMGAHLLELRDSRDPQGALALLRARGLADGAAFSVGTTLTVPLTGAAPVAVETLAALGDRGSSVTTRRPTLDDVYLQLTGSSLTGD